jgi:hypothetical protein
MKSEIVYSTSFTVLLCVPFLYVTADQVLFANQVLFAEIDWSTVITSVAAALTPIGAAIVAAARWMVGRLESEADKQRTHEKDREARIQSIIKDFREDLKGDREERQNTTELLLDLHGRNVETMGSLAGKVGELSLAIHELRGELIYKEDRPGRPPSSVKPK